MHNCRSNNTRDLFPGSDPRLSHGRPKKLPPGHFDPDELTRRLYIVLAEQQARAERVQRRREAQNQPTASQQRSSRGQPRPRESTTATGKPWSSEPPAPDTITQSRRAESRQKGGSQSTTATNNINATANEGTTTGQPEPYRHIPSQAAKQFARTTTVNTARNGEHVHALAKRALKYHSEDGPLTSGHGADDMTPAEYTRTLHKTISERERVFERNQFQLTRDLEEAARRDQELHHHNSPLHQQTFENDLARLFPSLSNQANRRNSTGAFNTADNGGASSAAQPNKRLSLLCPSSSDPRAFPENHGSQSAVVSPTFAPDDFHHHHHLDRQRCQSALVDHARVDWSQSDEHQQPQQQQQQHQQPRASTSMGMNATTNRAATSPGANAPATSGHSGHKRLLLTPLLRKADSLWMLKGRRGSKDASSSTATGAGEGATAPVKVEKAKSEGDASEAAAAAAARVGSPTSPTASGEGKGKGGFFARFRR
ncbi:hypothetical protein VTJ04DRAFT_8934 [Mycothermus thermophilus]|uniref:uncharacterized protein n=1 Tax=Humicola insolens TaxID=85995 RepID=UPI0037420EBC